MQANLFILLVGIDSLKDMAETIEKQESMNNKVIQYLGANPTERELVQKFNSITDP